MNPADVQAASVARNEHNDCAIRAVAVATGEDYDKVHDLFQNYGRQNRCRSKWGMELRAMKDLGYKCTPEIVKAKTVRTLEREVMAGRNYMVAVRGHLLGIHQGKVYDWSQGRQHRVHIVYWIRKKK